MPLPSKLFFEAGHLTIDSTFSVALTGYVEQRLEEAARRLVKRLSTQTGIPMAVRVTGASAQTTLALHCEGAAGEVQTAVEDESYTLIVTPDGARISAPKPYGVLHAIETFLQLVKAGDTSFAAPAVRIKDQPRFPWRGLMIDVCRHWMPIEVIKRNLDAMAAVKLNVLHLHLTEDQGFRVESRRFPKLHELGSDGNYFTQDEIREIVAYARERGIRVVPEFDVPGHATSWFVGYPELASAPGPYEIERTFGIKDPTMDPTREEVYEFLDQVFDEMVLLFPDPYFHIGGDEVTRVHWAQNPRIQAFIEENKLGDNHGLQAYFSRRIQAILQEKGKSIVGWDEILHPDLPKDTVVHSWRGQASLVEAAMQGSQGILSLGYYLDHNQPAEFHYGFDPMPFAADAAIDFAGPWRTWHVELSAPPGLMEGQLTVSGDAHNLCGLIAIKNNLWAELTDVKMDESTLSFRFHSGLGVVSAALTHEGDSIEGALRMAGFGMPIRGTRSAGSDMPGTEPPVVEGAPTLTPEQEGLILGGEACMWTELANSETIDSRMWPRLAAIAERLWSPVELTQDVEDMYRRLATTSDWLSWSGIEHQSNYPLMLQRMTIQNVDPLRELADLVEPVKAYNRHQSRPYSQFTPLNRIVDAVPAESVKARAFSKMANRLIDDPNHKANREAIETWLTSWRDNHAKLQPMLQASFLLQAIQPISRNLSDVAALGLEALEALQSGVTLTEAQQQRRLALLDRAAEPQDELLLEILPAVRRLVEATHDKVRKES